MNYSHHGFIDWQGKKTEAPWRANLQNARGVMHSLETVSPGIVENDPTTREANLEHARACLCGRDNSNEGKE
jgi:hypothetical protein